MQRRPVPFPLAERRAIQNATQWMTESTRQRAPFSFVDVLLIDDPIVRHSDLSTFVSIVVEPAAQKFRSEIIRKLLPASVPVSLERGSGKPTGASAENIVTDDFSPPLQRKSDVDPNFRFGVDRV